MGVIIGIYQERVIYINKYLKFVAFLFTLFLFAFMSAGTSHASMGSDSGNLIERKVKVTVTNNETGETTVLDPIKSIGSIEKKNSIKINSIQSVDNESVVEGHEVFIPIERITKKPLGDITPFDTGSGSKTAGGVTARLSVNYDLANTSTQQKIRLNKVYGSWTPSSSMYYLTDREVDAHSGSIHGKTISKEPTSNSFSYLTGFGYNVYATGQSSPRAWSSAISRISGMTATYTITLDITFP